ncbi:MAG: PEGA domain-containing protein, partial [Deltaproteobacteria bacterium]|nr:PEGA domain-containing protein [Deltaproteobacteria bacterium]
MSHNRRRSSALALALALALAPSARADTPEADAQREYQLGYQALQAGDCVVALSHYQRSYQLAPRPRTLFNMAACQETLQQDALAWRSYHAFLEQAEPRDAEIAVKARARIEALRQRLTGRLVVDSTPAGAAVVLDDDRQPRGATPLTLAIPPGTHRVRLTQPGAIPAERSVEITPEATSSLAVDLALPSAIVIQVEPADAQIVADDGGAPARGRLDRPVSPGRYAFTISRAGYRTEHVAIDAVASRTYAERVVLQPLPARATLVLAGAAGAAITVDGRAASTTGV